MNAALIDVGGTVDLHCHPYPDLFPRLTDDAGVVQAAVDRGMAAVMIKCHHESSVSRAYHMQKLFPDVHVFGGIVLNHAVGGINPAAVDAALRLGGKEVWMPTVDAAHHAEVHGGTGAYDAQASGLSARAGIAILKEDGGLRAEVLDVLTLVAEHNAILGTCHLAPREIVMLVEEARRRGVQKILVTHPFFKVPNLDLETLRHLTGLGAIAEFGYCTISPMWAYASPKRVAEAVQALGAQHCVLVSDTGQRHNPLPAEALRVFAQSLFESGLDEEAVYTMIQKNPTQLLDI
jgi:Family of unknown function (DUF6282)